jgi:hypothetical protein
MLRAAAPPPKDSAPTRAAEQRVAAASPVAQEFRVVSCPPGVDPVWWTPIL